MKTIGKMLFEAAIVESTEDETEAPEATETTTTESSNLTKREQVLAEFDDLLG